MPSQRYKDLEFGSKGEKSVKSRLEEKFGELEKTVGRYNLFDFEADNLYIELKSRRNTKDKYPTTMIGMNKINKGFELLKEDSEVYFCFNFTDKLCYYKLHPDSLSECGIGKGGRWDRCGAEIKQYCWIPIELLTDI